MRIIKEKRICACCKTETIQNKILSFSTSDMDLDGKDFVWCNLSQVMECPVCHYCAKDIGKIEKKEQTIKMIKENAYQNIFKNDFQNRAIARWIAKGFLEESAYKYKYAALSYLKATWCLEEEKQEEMSEKYREKAVSCMRKYLETHMDIEMAYLYIESNRRLGEFEEAFETIDSLAEYVERQENITLLLNFERKLCKEKDSMPHKRREVMDER